MKKILAIDVAEPPFMSLILLGGGNQRKKFKIVSRGNLLICLDRFLKRRKIGFQDLGGLALIEGGGSFSTVRTAAAVLNTFFWVVKIPLCGADKRKYGGDEKKMFAAVEKYFRHPRRQLLKPIYSGEPHITMSSPRKPAYRRQAGTQSSQNLTYLLDCWIPAFAGMTICWIPPHLAGRG